MNSFQTELLDLIDKHKDHPGVALEELIDALETEAEKLAEQVNERSDKALRAEAAEMAS
jgi:hypothetical protein